MPVILSDASLFAGYNQSGHPAWPGLSGFSHQGLCVFASGAGSHFSACFFCFSAWLRFCGYGLDQPAGTYSGHPDWHVVIVK